MSYVETPDYDDYVPEMIEMHPLGRLGKPEDVATSGLIFCIGYVGVDNRTRLNSRWRLYTSRVKCSGGQND